MDSRISRFARCRTPMGSIPISVIMGFEYPLEEGSGRGEESYQFSSSNNRASSRSRSSCAINSYNNSCLDSRSGTKLSYETLRDASTTLRSSAERTIGASRYSSKESIYPLKDNSYSSLEDRSRYSSYYGRAQDISSGRWRPSSMERARGTSVDILEPSYSSAAAQSHSASMASDTLRESRARYIRSSDSREHPKQQPCRYAAALSSTFSSTPRYTRAMTVGPQVVSPRYLSSFSTAPSKCSAWSSSSSRVYFSSVRSRFL